MKIYKFIGPSKRKNDFKNNTINFSVSFNRETISINNFEEYLNQYLCFELLIELIGRKIIIENKKDYRELKKLIEKIETLENIFIFQFYKELNNSLLEIEEKMKYNWDKNDEVLSDIELNELLNEGQIKYNEDNLIGLYNYLKSVDIQEKEFNIQKIEDDLWNECYEELNRYGI